MTFIRLMFIFKVLAVSYIAILILGCFVLLHLIFKALFKSNKK